MKYSFGVVALAALSAAAPSTELSKRNSNYINDVKILQYALTLENLENVFYRQGLAKFNQAAFAAAGYDATFYNNIRKVSKDESSHVAFLRGALGNKAVPECTYKFTYPDVKTFIATASILEGVGVSAYLGAAASIANKAYLTAAGSILTVEARHSAYIRAGLRQSPFPASYDVPLGFNEVFSLAAAFINKCNYDLGFRAFPALTVDAQTAYNPGEQVIVRAAKQYPVSNYGKYLYCAWTVPGVGIQYTAASATGSTGRAYKCNIPSGTSGQTYVVLAYLKKGEKIDYVTDDKIVAGPAIIEVV